mgnify:CR=1 FL=1
MAITPATNVKIPAIKKGADFINESIKEGNVLIHCAGGLSSSISFLIGVRLNIAIEQDNKSFLKLKIKVRDKIVADGFEDDDYDIPNKTIH